LIVKKLPLSQLDKFRDSWNTLLNLSNSFSYFLTWEWIYAYVKSSKIDDSELLILLCFEDSKLIAIAPFYQYSDSFFGIKIIKIGFLGNTVASDYMDIITLPEFENESCKAIWEFIDANCKYLYEFADLLPDSNIYKFFNDTKTRIFPKGYVFEKETCPRIILPETFEKYFKKLSSNTRYNFKRRLKQLSSDFSEPILINDIKSDKEELDKLFELHRKRWSVNSEKKSTFNNLYRKEFNNILVSLCKNRKELIFSKFIVNENIESILYIFRYKNHYYFYQNGWNPEFSKYSIGMLHLIMFIEYAIQNDAKTFDLLRGNEGYKSKLSNDVRKTYMIYAPSILLLPNLYVQFIVLKKRIRKILSVFSKFSFWGIGN
jgi:hypothetical protein